MHKIGVGKTFVDCRCEQDSCTSYIDVSGPPLEHIEGWVA